MFSMYSLHAGYGSCTQIQLSTHCAARVWCFSRVMQKDAKGKGKHVSVWIDLCRRYLWLSSLPTGCHYCSTEIHPWNIYLVLRADSKDHLLAADWKFLIVFAGILYIYVHFAIEFYIKVHHFIAIRKESIAKASAVMTVEVQIVSHENQPAEKLAVIILKPLVLIIILLLCSCWRWSQHSEWTLPVSSNLLSTSVIFFSQRCACCVVYYSEIALEYSKSWVAERPSNALVRRLDCTPSTQLLWDPADYPKSLMSVSHGLFVSHRLPWTFLGCYNKINKSGDSI